MFELSIKGHISSAHFLRGYEGKCKNLHGHNWKVDVTILGEKLNAIGMVADFGELKDALNEILSRLDHICLNELPPFQEENPTTENIARYIYAELEQKVSPLKVKEVRVWESDSANVAYWEN